MTKNKAIITCAITGAMHTPTMSDALPITPEQIARESIEAAAAGAAIIHLHARVPETGEPTGNPEVFGRFHRVISNSGGDHLLYMLECSCQHKQNGAKVCKHEAAAASVEEFVKADAPRQEMRRQMEAARGPEAVRAEVEAIYGVAA